MKKIYCKKCTFFIKVCNAYGYCKLKGSNASDIVSLNKCCIFRLPNYKERKQNEKAAVN